MRNYIIKRLVMSIFILFFVALIMYSIMRCIPTSFVENIARQRSTLPGAKSYKEQLAQLNELYGLNTSPLEGFFIWLKSAVRGQFGDSWFYNVPVIEKFKSVIWYSFGLAAVALVLEVLIAVPLGIVAATHQYKPIDYFVTVFSLIGISLPTFYFATILKYVFSIKLGWVDLYGVVGRFHEFLTPGGKFLDIVQHMILPTVTLTFVSLGSLMRYTRTNMLEVLGSDYIRTARAKGLPESRVVNYHAFRNTLIPIVTIVGGTIPTLFGGAMITETLFQIPGIGYISYQAMVAGDIPFYMFYSVFLAVLTLLGTLVADILYAVVDPRIRIEA